MASDPTSIVGTAAQGGAFRTAIIARAGLLVIERYVPYWSGSAAGLRCAFPSGFATTADSVIDGTSVRPPHGDAGSKGFLAGRVDSN